MADVLVTIREAADTYGLPQTRLKTWYNRRLLKRRGSRRDAADLPAALYSLADIRSLADKFATDPVPEGYIPVREAARRLRITPGTVTGWVLAKKLAAVTLRIEGRPTRYVRESDIAVEQTVNANSARNESYLIGEQIGAAPVAYGLLTQWDADVLERRRQKFLNLLTQERPKCRTKRKPRALAIATR